MSSTNKTPNYNLSQFIDSDKPSWRGDYNSDMSKIDTSIKGACTQAQAAATIATDAKTTATSALAKATDNATAIATVTDTANTALSLARTNEGDIAANETAFQQYKTQTASKLATMSNQISLKANAADVPTKAYADEHYANHLVAQAAAYKTGTERDFTMTSPTDYKEVQFDAPSTLHPAWADLSSDHKDVALTPGVYQVNFELRLINIAAGGEAYKTSIRCEICDMAGSSPNVLGYTDTYFVKESTNSATLTGSAQAATLSIVESVGAPQHIRLRLHAAHMDPAHAISGRINHAGISFVKLADAMSTRERMAIEDVGRETWSSGN